MGFLSKITDGLGITDSKATDRALTAQTDAMNRANSLLKEQYGEAKERYKPWQDQGLKGLNALSAMAGVGNFSNAENPLRNHNGVFGMEDFKKDPGYEFRMNEGMKALNRNAAASGGLGGGAAIKALARYSQNFASNEYQNAYNRFNQDYSSSYNRYNSDVSNQFNRYNTLANYGQNANNAITGQGSNYANTVANNHMSMGNATANAEMNRNNWKKDLWKMGIKAGAAAYGAGAFG